MELRYRQDVAKLVAANGIGIELGVAEGVFSERVLQSSTVGFLYGVDRYAGGGHNVAQYRRAMVRLMPYRNRHTILRMRFHEALDLFPDEYFDFVYVDGYAHNGEEGGRTIREWYPKLKSGGILSGDDYSPSWPLVQAAVDAFVCEQGLALSVIECGEPGVPWCKYPTWWTRKR